MKVMRSTLAMALLATCLVAGRVDAQPSLAEKNLAQALFDEGRAAVAGGRIDEACSKFGESYRIEQSAGTLLNLALCHEKQGKMASAYVELNESISRAIKDGRPERERTAREHLAIVTPKLSRLAVSVSSQARVAGVVVKIDGVAIGEPAWGVSAPVDPGEHAVEATAPGKRAWKAIVKVGRDGDNVKIDVPAFADEAPAVAPPPPPVQPPPPPPVEPPHEPAPKAHDTQKTLAWVALGIGAAGLATGGIFGGLALSRWQSAKADCGDHLICESDEEKAKFDKAGTFADVSTIGFAIFGVGLAAGAFLWLTAGDSHAAIAPMIGKNVGGVTIGGGL
jgi:hypothetical protein